MKELVIISGKGGTGKTSLTASFAALAEDHVLCDADVDAADLHLLMNPRNLETHPFMGGGIAAIRTDDCTQCGTCLDLCRFGAISKTYQVDAIDCEGCGVCVDLCPVEAIDFPIQQCGEWFISETRYGPMVHARLGIAEENSGKLVSVIRQQAKELAETGGHRLILTDGPPGIGCPVIASITGATALLIVVEPTVSGLHDMRRVAQLAVHFKIPTMLLINKFDLNQQVSATIAEEAAAQGITLAGRIPFDPDFTRAMVAGQNLFEYPASAELRQLVTDIWKTVIGSEPMTAPDSPDFLKTIKQ